MELDNNKTTRLQQEMKTALGQEPGDLFITNIKIVDVYTETIMPGSLLVRNGKIVAVNPSFDVKAKNTYDGGGLYALPGFIDPYCHIDCTYVMPDALSEAIVPCGTTTVVGEIPDFGSAFSECDSAVRAIKNYYKDLHLLPYRLLPLSTGKAVVKGVNDELLKWDKIFGQGEVHGHTTLGVHEDTLKKITNIRDRRMYFSGHIDPFVDGDKINVFVTAGNQNDHETWTYQALIERLRRGVAVMVRFSNECVENLIPEVLNNHLPTDNLLFCTDNIIIDDLMSKGHIDNLIRKSINMGMDPIKAIKMATYNTARVLKLDHLIGSLTPGRYADIVLVDNLRNIVPQYVFNEGILVAENGKVAKHAQIDYSDLKIAAKPGLDFLSANDLCLQPTKEQLSEDGTQALVTVLDVNTSKQFTAWLPVVNGAVASDPDQDILQAVALQRYKSDGKARLLIAFVRGFDMRNGTAIARNILQDFSQPDIHGQEFQRILAVGTDVENMVVAMHEVDQRSGAIVVACNGKVSEVLPFPHIGLISDLSSHEAADILKNMNKTMNKDGRVTGERYLKLFFIGSLDYFGMKTYSRYI